MKIGLLTVVEGFLVFLVYFVFFSGFSGLFCVWFVLVLFVLGWGGGVGCFLVGVAGCFFWGRLGTYVCLI